MLVNTGDQPVLLEGSCHLKCPHSVPATALSVTQQHKYAENNTHAYMFAAMTGTPVHVLLECLKVYVLLSST